uniref:Uncharacterized protein n=1 Tax=Globodera rostochiensis TaxID=31243 RepID=A0A914I8Q2_GLORO
MTEQFEPLSDTDEFAKLDRQLEEMKTIRMEESQKSLMEEVEALKKEVTEMKKLKASRKRKTVKTREEGTEEAEKNEKEAKKETEQKSGEKIRKEEELSKEKEPEITILERENRIRLDDEISLNLELEEEERILFSTPRGAENEKMSYWQTCLNRVKSRGELEKGSIGKTKKPTDPIRVAKSEIKSAELSIWQKRSEEIPPEGKQINQLDCSMNTEREENREKFESGKANRSDEKNIFMEEKKSKEAQEITALLLNLREKSLEIHDEAEKIMRKVEKAFEMEEKREKRGALWQQHDVRWPVFERNNRRGSGNWNESRGGWSNQRGARGWRRGRGQWHDRNEWGPSTSQQAEDFSKMAGWG